MTEQHYPERQPQKSPQELNQELRGVFQLLPDANIFYAKEGVYDIDPSGRLVDTRTPEQWREDMDNLAAQLERRKRSEILPLLQSRLQGLLGQSHLTPSARTYMGWEFDEMAVEGLEREDYSSELPFVTELQFYTSLFQWDNPESGGIFDSEQARDIDKRLYHRAVDETLLRQRLHRQFEEGEGMQDFLRQVLEAGIKTGEKIKTMSPEELEEHNKQIAKSDEAAHEIIRRREEEQALIKVWREEYSTRYGDEP
jgi:hypothetical protein